SRSSIRRAGAREIHRARPAVLPRMQTRIRLPSMNVAHPAGLPARPRRRWRAPPASRDVLWLLLFALMLLSAGLGLRDPWPADEPRFAMIARDIVESGRWFLPQRGPELYAEKPPVFIWMQALALRATG